MEKKLMFKRLKARLRCVAAAKRVGSDGVDKITDVFVAVAKAMASKETPKAIEGFPGMSIDSSGGKHCSLIIYDAVSFDGSKCDIVTGMLSCSLKLVERTMLDVSDDDAMAILGEMALEVAEGLSKELKKKKKKC